MILSDLLKGVEVLADYRNVEVIDIKTDSNQIMDGNVYVCISGATIDGHIFAKTASQKGAVAVVVQSPSGGVNEVLVADTKKAYAVMCGNLFFNKAKQLKLIATTGTNGKTSVSTIIKRLLCDANVECGLISTIRAEYGNHCEELARTTPDAYILNKLFYDMEADGMKVVAMEASSHALDQKRLYNMHFNIAVFTNLTQDHLDYHKNMLEYFSAKKKLFDMTDYGVVNVDDDYGIELTKLLRIPFVTYSTKNQEADFYADLIVCYQDGVEFRLSHNNISFKVKFAIPGIYSVENALAATAVCMKMGMSIENIVSGLSKIEGIKGRNEVIKTGKNFQVICDYAHTPDGLENILKSTKQYAKGRVVLLFGCGGDRDKTKRPVMGKIAEEYADFVVVTSDNPRTENPASIINDILKGMGDSRKYIAIVDRKDAIRYALATAKPKDIIILAGKGHEQYQVLGDKKLYFDERKLVKGIINSIN